MPQIVIEILLFILGLILLVKGGDWFVDAATGIAHRFHMPEILIGATVVSIGTTIPEVMVSSAAAIKGSSAIAYGNAIGSIICNTALIAAITMSFRPDAVDKKALRTPMCFFFAAATFYTVIAYAFGEFSRPVGITLLAVFFIYITLSVRKAKVASRNASQNESAKAEEVSSVSSEEPGEETKKESSIHKDLFFLIVGASLIAVGANLLVDHGTAIAQIIGIPESVIALTFVALGTSLPELVTAITALIKGHSDLSLGNVIGANLFNLILVSGMACTIHPFTIPVEKVIAGANASLVLDVPVMVSVSLIMCIPALIKGKLYRAQGIVLLLIYFGYIASQFIL